MRLRRPSHGTVAAYLALFVALGGTSYAAASLPSRSVGAKQLRRHAVTNSKIKPGAVTASRVRNGSLSAKDFKAGSLPKGPAGPAGPAGPQGPAGGGATIGFGAVAANGTVSPATASGLSSANVQAVPGGYCFTGLSATPRNVQATAQNGFFGPVVANATIGQFGACPKGTQVTVVLTAVANSTPAAVNTDFFIQID